MRVILKIDCYNYNSSTWIVVLYNIFRYPKRLGWQLKISRKDIRSSEAYYRLHNFLISETGNGNISRQETVSMIPPILLNIKPTDKVFNYLIYKYCIY